MGWRLLSMGLLIFIATTMLAPTGPAWTGELLAQEAGLNAAALAPRNAEQFLGVDRCERCHQAPTPTDIDNRVTDFVLLNESKVWSSDIHSQAYRLLDPATSSLSKQICDKLQITDISQAQQCLSCHSNWLQGADRPPTYQRGVACESCHGASEHWDVPHSRPDWRKKPVAEKEESGMTDVRNPVRRAEQCFGCHIGNAAEGKLITHAMYAAGHPPLPGIEIESFAAQMPRHWRYLEEKVADVKSKRAGNEADSLTFTHFDEFLRQNHEYLDLADGTFNEQVAVHKHRAAAVVLGGAIALREYVELLRDLAHADESAPVAWPELAAFDCRACHHELKLPSRRQEQRFGGTPGRPVVPDWPATLVPLAISHASASPSVYEKQLAVFRAKLGAVDAELERTPFGAPMRLQSACSDLVDWLDSAVIAPALARPFASRAVTESFKLLCKIGSEESHDFDSARQIAWSLRILSCGIAKEELRQALHDSLEPLAQELRLDLPNGPPDHCAPISTIDESRQLTPLVADISAALAVPIQYDPDRFRQQMLRLRELLSAGPKRGK